MKTFRICLLVSIILLNFSTFGLNLKGSTKDPVQEGLPVNDISQTKPSLSDEASQYDESQHDTSLSAHQALQDFKLYLNKQIAKHNLNLTPEQIESFIAKGRSLIYENSQEGNINQSNSRKIQKDFKLYLKTLYPDNFKPKRYNNEVNFKLARRRIRAITKDFVVNKLQVKNSTEVKEYWNKVKGMVYKKLDKAAYFNDFYELVVDESAIPEIIGKVFNKLEAEYQNGKPVTHNTQNNPKRKRKAAVPEKISAPIAEKLVVLMIRNKGISAKNNETLTRKIMKKINKNIKRGKIDKEFVITTAKEEIKEFLDLKSNVTKKTSERYLDRFIKAMGKTPETDHN